MEVLYPHCAGVDVHKQTLVVCQIHTAADGSKRTETRSFGTTTAELWRVRDWLTAGACTHAALESTGEYTPPTILPRTW